MVEGAGYVRTVEGNPETQREGEEPREDEKEKGILGTVLLTISKLTRTEDTNSF